MESNYLSAAEIQRDIQASARLSSGEKKQKVFGLDELELVHPDLLKKSRVRRRVVSQ